MRDAHDALTIIGHGHPKAWPKLKRFYERIGIKPVKDFAEVIERASLYCVDNSSTMYEWAALDRPVVVLNAPWFRREVRLGLRFWEYADVGFQVDEPDKLNQVIRWAVTDPPEQAQRRREIVRAVYGDLDGQASVRAVAAIRDLAPVEAMPVRKPDPAQHTRHPPVARLRQLGATDSEIFAFTQEWSGMDVGERVAAQDAFATLDDDGVRDKIAEWRHG